jgi:uncharacterized protein
MLSAMTSRTDSPRRSGDRLAAGPIDDEAPRGSWGARWLSHGRTVGPRLLDSLRPPGCPATEPWACTVADPRWGAVRLAGRLRRLPGSRALVLLVHGLGGGSDSAYVRRGAQAAEAAGLSCLRIDLRGADLSGEDFYHGGLGSDLAAALASPGLAEYESFYLLGYSLGGHLALRHAADGAHPRLRAVAAICAPLELEPAQRAIDRPGRWPYRSYLLRRLKKAAVAIARRRPLPAPLATVMAARTLWQWDASTVVPRFGFADVEDYYRQASVGPLLPRLTLPALLVACPEDPMVPYAAVAPAARRAGDALEVRWIDHGGHPGFPRALDLGVDAPPGIAAQVLGWLLRAG